VPQLRAYLEEHLEQQPFRSHLKDLLVEFNEAAASSLNLLIVAVFMGSGPNTTGPFAASCNAPPSVPATNTAGPFHSSN
jgi:hypothetical protein